MQNLVNLGLTQVIVHSPKVFDSPKWISVFEENSSGNNKALINNKVSNEHIRLDANDQVNQEDQEKIKTNMGLGFSRTVLIPNILFNSSYKIKNFEIEF